MDAPAAGLFVGTRIQLFAFAAHTVWSIVECIRVMFVPPGPKRLDKWYWRYGFRTAAPGIGFLGVAPFVWVEWSRPSQAGFEKLDGDGFDATLMSPGAPRDGPVEREVEYWVGLSFCQRRASRVHRPRELERLSDPAQMFPHCLSR